MNFIKRLFQQPQDYIQCPRCLGKGHVDEDDITRLGNELYWLPGKCAYCNSKGKVDPKIVESVAPNEVFLSTDRTQIERLRIIDRDPAILQEKRIFDERREQFIQQIIELHFSELMSPEQITNLYMEAGPRLSEEDYAKEKKELLRYVEKVIAYHQ
ncbi:MAG: hypothetical protein JO154_23245 [Chitinophaga sp.]|uniref:hypothetical protein n=1 Tax=Chitinophaga sp. TaxID=1869181 RepID=UPI0025B80FC2|nr:hypothetical protein [Chitinophaga sp.]MBV8255532.1 hypothetical protein [Chitinophaga sp.]